MTFWILCTIWTCWDGLAAGYWLNSASVDC